jgi:hypothetical protein
MICNNPKCLKEFTGSPLQRYCTRKCRDSYWNAYWNSKRGKRKLSNESKLRAKNYEKNALNKEMRKKQRAKFHSECKEGLKDPYIRKLIRQRFGPSVATPDFIELKRTHIKLKRIINGKEKESNRCSA